MLATEFSGYEKGALFQTLESPWHPSSGTGKGPLIYQQLNTLLGSGVFNSDGEFLAWSSSDFPEADFLVPEGEMWK